MSPSAAKADRQRRRGQSDGYEQNLGASSRLFARTSMDVTPGYSRRSQSSTPVCRHVHKRCARYNPTHICLIQLLFHGLPRTFAAVVEELVPPALRAVETVGRAVQRLPSTAHDNDSTVDTH